jgi:thiamine pyrophosphate-dependent acetolactate synthase large subunit-like protein
VTDAAAAILQTLAAAGVRTAFGLPGVHNLAFWAADGPLEIIGTRHEQTTVYAADGLARATGGLGIALTTTGPGAANAVAAFGEAAACGSPVLLVASDTSTAIARPGVVRGGLHESADQAALFEPLAKAVHRPRTAQDAVDAVAQGAAQAMQWPRGPVYVGVPTDLLTQEAIPRAIAPAVRRAPEPAGLAAAAELIAAAQRVVIWAGGGVVQSGAGEAVGRLAARVGAPVIEGWAGRGALAPDHPWLVGLPPHEPEATELLARADLLVAIGTALDGPSTMNWRLPLPERLIAINADPVDADKNYPATVAIVADAREAVTALADALPDRPADPADVLVLRERVRDRLAADADTADAWRFVSALDEAVAAHDPVVLCDMAIPGYWAAGYAAVTGPRRMQYPVGWGTLGYALPASIGPAVAGDGPVLAICGDGGFMFAVGELAVLAEHDLPVTVLLVDDGGYGMLRFDQTLAGAPHRGVDLGRPDFELLADAFGIPAARTDLDGLAETLDAALHAAAPRLVLLEAALHPPATVSARWPRMKETG